MQNSQKSKQKPNLQHQPIKLLLIDGNRFSHPIAEAVSVSSQHLTTQSPPSSQLSWARVIPLMPLLLLLAAAVWES